MYLRTPKRYRPGRHRHLRLFSGRTLLILLVIPAVVYLGWLVWDNQGDVRSSVESAVDNSSQWVQTQIAPVPTPTATPDVAVAQSGCVNAYRAGDLETAIEECEVLAEASPNDVELHYRITHMLVITSSFGRDQQRVEEALSFAERTVSAAPESPYGWAIRAMVLDWSGDYESALASALHAKSLDPNFAPTYAFLGEIYQDLNKYDVAMGYLEQAVTLDTSGLAVADTFRNKGLWYSNQGQWEDAVQLYQAALQNAPNHTYIAIELANNYIALYVASGQTDETMIDKAIEVLSSTWQRNPSDASVLFALANAHTRKGNLDRAYEYYGRCLDMDPENIPCLSYLGGLQWSDGDFVTAAINLEQAIELGSDDPDDYYQLGHSHASLGRCDLAIPYLEQGLLLVQQREDEARIQRISNVLNSCGVRVDQPVKTAEPEVQTTPDAESG